MAVWQPGLSEKEVKDLQYRYPHRVKSNREQSTIYSEATSSLAGSAGYDPFIDEAQELYLSGQIMNLSDEQNLHELHLYDLQYQKQKLLLDLRELEVLYGEVQGKRSQEMEALESEIQEIINQEKEIRIKVMVLEKAAIAYPQDIDLLKMENKALENKIIRLKR